MLEDMDEDRGLTSIGPRDVGKRELRVSKVDGHADHDKVRFGILIRRAMTRQMRRLTVVGGQFMRGN